MTDKMKKSWQEKYHRLKKTLRKVLSPNKQQSPQLILQPYRHKQPFER